MPVKPTAEELFGSAGTPQVGVVGSGFGGIATGVNLKRAGVSTRDEAALEALANGVRIDFIPGESGRVLLDGEDVSSLIRTPEISMAASDVSAVPAVRRVLVRLPISSGPLALPEKDAVTVGLLLH